MEAILRSVLLRQEQMELQWDAEFEQQKQLFHINTSTLIDMFPIQPRKKRLKLEGRVQPIPVHDKENLVEFQNGSLKSKASHTRGLAKRDLNTRFCENEVKGVGRVGTKQAESQPSLRNCLEAERMQPSASIVHAVKSSCEVPVKVEVDEGDLNVSPPTVESAPGGSRKRVRGEQVEDVVVENRNEENVVLLDDREKQVAVVDPVEKNVKPKRARKTERVKECAVEVEAQEPPCRDADAVEPQVVCKVEVEAEVCRDSQVVEVAEIVSNFIEPEVESKKPGRRGRPKATTTVPKANVRKEPVRRGRAKVATTVPEANVSEEPVRRGRLKQSSVSTVAPRVTRSRARMVDSVVEPKPGRVTQSKVVESEPEICEAIPSTEVVSKEPARQEVKVEAVCEADVQNQTVEGVIEASNERAVCVSPKENESRARISSQSTAQASITIEDIAVTDGVVKRGSSHVDTREEAVSAGSKDAKLNSCVQEILAELKGTPVDQLKDTRPQPQVNMIEHREVAALNRCKDNDPQVRKNTTAIEEISKDVRCLSESERDTLVEKVIEGGSEVHVKVEVGEMQVCVSEAPCSSAARLSACGAARQRLGRGTKLTNISKIPRANIKEPYTTLLSEVIEGSHPQSKKSSDSETRIATSLQSSEAINDVHVVATVGMTIDSPVAGDDSREHPVGILNVLPSGRQGLESGDNENNSESNEEMSLRETMENVVVIPEGSQLKEPNNVETSKDEPSRLEVAREQVKSDEVSPVRYSEARAIEEAIRSSLEQEFHPDVTLTLNRWQFRKRLSPRSKARARRWRSDVATNGVDYARGQSSDAPAAASPSRKVSSGDRSLEGVAYETFLEAHSPDAPVQEVLSFSLGAGKAIDQADTFSQEGHTSLIVPSQEDNAVEYEIMQTADESGNRSALPLLQSIYTLSKACQNDMVGAQGFLEEGEQQQVQTLIESAKKIMNQLTNKGVEALPKTPAATHPALNNSRFHGHTNLYPDRLRLFLTPKSSPAAPPIFPPSSSTFLPSAAPEDGSLLPGDIEATSPMKHPIPETLEQAGHVATPALSTVKSTTTSDNGHIYQSGKGGDALKSSPGSTCLIVVDPIQVKLAAGIEIDAGTSTSSPAIRSTVLQNVNGGGSTQVTVELVSHQSDGTLDMEIVTETERLSELRSRFYALSKDCAGTSSPAKDVPTLLLDAPESFISHPSSPPPNLRVSPGTKSKQRKGAKKTPGSSKNVHFDAVEIELPAIQEEATRIPCSPIFFGIKRERVDVEREDNSEPAEEPQPIADAAPSVMLGVETQCSSNLIKDVSSLVPSTSNPPRSNLVTSLRSFIPLVQQQQPAAPYPNGKRDVKVKALEAAEAAKRLAEQKELEKQERRKATELAKREKQERAAQEKLVKKEKAAQEKLKQQEARAERDNEEANRRKGAAAAATKSAMTDSTNCQGANNQNVLLKVKKTHELKLKMDQEKQERLLEEQRKKEEEWKRKEAENAARKRKHEAAEKKEREEKRRRQEEAVKAHRGMEEQQRLELDKKTQKQKAMEEYEKERKAVEEELKRKKRLDKEREVEQRRKQEEERESKWLNEKEATRKRKEEAAKQIKILEAEGRLQAGKIRRPSEDPAMPSAGPYHSFMASLHIALGEGVTAYPSSGYNVVDPQRVSSQSLAGHALRVPQHSAEGAAGALRNSQAALRVPRTTPESVPGSVLGSGKPLFRTPPETLVSAALASTAVSGGGASAGLRDQINILQVQSVSNAVVGGIKPSQPGQVAFAGPPGGVVVDKGVQSYDISPFRDSEDEDSEEEEKRSHKPIPLWARKENMLPQLLRQLGQDPDDIFIGASSCSLDEVFAVRGSRKRPDFRRRGSSGDWAKDCLTWQEQIQYKVTMGYLN